MFVHWWLSWMGKKAAKGESECLAKKDSSEVKKEK
tara:strand:+ start:426 stop:530 length:105 start_codon:yes stop_codon:yes gene_type:complete